MYIYIYIYTYNTSIYIYIYIYIMFARGSSNFSAVISSRAGVPKAWGTPRILLDSGVHKGGFSKGGFSNLCASLVQL